LASAKGASFGANPGAAGAERNGADYVAYRSVVSSPSEVRTESRPQTRFSIF